MPSQMASNYQFYDPRLINLLLDDTSYLLVNQTELFRFGPIKDVLPARELVQHRVGILNE